MRIKPELRKIHNEISAYLWALLKKDKPDNKFIIFSQGRSGSHLLTDLLNCHPNIFCETEICQAIKVRELLFPLLYIKGRAVRFKKNIYGFQLKPRHLNESCAKINPQELIRALDKNNWKIIHLQRRNVLRQAISAIIGHHRQQWHGTMEKSFVNSKTIIDCNELFREIHKREVRALLENQILAQLPSYLEVIYEDDLLNSEQHQKTANRVFDYLGVDYVPIKTDLIRASSDKLSDMIENYDQILNVLSNTKYVKFLGS